MQRFAVSIDTETLGLGEQAKVIQVGAVVFDIFSDELQAATEFLVSHHFYHHVEPYAASMHAPLLRALGMKGDPEEASMSPTAKEYDEANTPPSLRCSLQAIIPDARVTAYFNNWLESNYPSEDGKIVVTGKNFGSFDREKLEKLPFWRDIIRIKHRFIDPGNLFWVPSEDGAELPNTQTCMERAGVDGDVKHTALADAIEVARMVQEYVRRSNG